MRYHTWKSSSTRILLIADSQETLFQSGNLNILSLLGAGIRKAYDFLPHLDLCDKIILFIGGNDPFDGCEPSDANPKDVAIDLIDIANTLVHRAKDFVLRIQKETKINSGLNRQTFTCELLQCDSR